MADANKFGECPFCKDPATFIVPVETEQKYTEGTEMCARCAMKLAASFESKMRNYAVSHLLVTMQAMSAKYGLTPHVGSVAFWKLVSEGILSFRSVVGSKPRVPGDEEIGLLAQIAAQAGGWWGVDRKENYEFVPFKQEVPDAGQQSTEEPS